MTISPDCPLSGGATIIAPSTPMHSPSITACLILLPPSVPQAPQEVPGIGRENPAGSPAGRPAGQRQDLAGQGCGRGSCCSVLLHLGIGVCGDVRRGRGQSRKGSL